MTTPWDKRAYEADGLAFEIDFDPADPLIPVLTGRPATVHARTGTTTVAGTAVATGPKLVACTFPPRALAPDVWRVQVRVDGRTVADFEATIDISLIP